MAVPRRTLLGALVRGLAAGAIGTAAMTAHQEIVAKLRDSDSSGTADGEAQQDPWQSAPAPAKVAKRVIEGVFQARVSPDKIGLLSNAMHWGYGTFWGAVYGLLQETVGGEPQVMGPLFGSGVWASSYVQLVPMGLYQPPWTYSPKMLANDLGYHLTYGVGVAFAYTAIDGR